jgi:YD repeat-containing protein
VFDYDALDRLVSASASGGDSGLGDYSLEMAYDPGSGNLSQKGELYYRYLDSGHSHAVTAVSDGWRYDYDPNGNLVRKVSQPWSLLELYLPVVMSSLPEEALESQSAPLSPYPPPEAQSRAEPAGLLAWLHSAWDALVSWFGGGTQTAQAAALQQAYPPPGDPTPTPTFTSTPDPTPTSTPVPTATPDPPEEIEYTYDAENRLVSVSAGEMQASFVYDGVGQRVASVIAGEVTVYIGEV